MHPGLVMECDYRYGTTQCVVRICCVHRKRSRVTHAKAAMHGFVSSVHAWEGEDQSPEGGIPQPWRSPLTLYSCASSR